MDPNRFFVIGSFASESLPLSLCRGCNADLASNSLRGLLSILNGDTRVLDDAWKTGFREVVFCSGQCRV
ncbi:hypothetical protein RRSWK_05467 [Rhodopirellula sp. SWK7]|nr:hypothetical protein RRSWK_05467 [Rhodopirellula sp. SWK7]